jgi:PAS domain S-box-containing protein
MLDEFLQDRAALYVAGGMPAEEREGFEVVLEARPDLRTHLAGLQEVAVVVALSGVTATAEPPAGLKSRLLAALEAQPAVTPEALVLTDATGCIDWVSPEFTAMCGFSLAELRGRKPGQVLQGAGTDPRAVGRMRDAVRAGRACRETLVNYHKDGSAYQVDIRMTPLLDDEGRPMWFTARERKIPEMAPAG